MCFRWFGFTSGFGALADWWWHGPRPWGFSGQEERIRWLERYREELQAELHHVEAELERVKREGR